MSEVLMRADSGGCLLGRRGRDARRASLDIAAGLTLLLAILLLWYIYPIWLRMHRA